MNLKRKQQSIDRYRNKRRRTAQQQHLHKRAIQAARKGNQLALEEMGAGTLRVNYGRSRWSMKACNSGSCLLCPNASSSGRTNTAWLCTVIAACHGHLHIMQWAKRNQLPLNQETFEAAFEAAVRHGDTDPNYSLRHRYLTSVQPPTLTWHPATLTWLPA